MKRSQFDGRVRTVLASATEILEELTLRAGTEDDLQNTCGSIELLVLQMEKELSMWESRGFPSSSD